MVFATKLGDLANLPSLIGVLRDSILLDADPILVNHDHLLVLVLPLEDGGVASVALRGLQVALVLSDTYSRELPGIGCVGLICVGELILVLIMSILFVVVGL